MYSYLGWYQPIVIRFVVEILVIFAVMVYAQIEVLAMYDIVTAVNVDVMPVMMMGQMLTMAQMQ